MAYTSLTSAQTDAKSPIDQQMMDLIRTNEDDLDSRVTTLEDDKDVSDYVDSRFDDGVVDPADPIIGSGNTGLTSTASTNPRSLSFADLRPSIGIERVYFRTLVPVLDEATSDDLPVWKLPDDDRFRFYGGSWKIIVDFDGDRVQASTSGDYFTCTAVCDSFAPLVQIDTTSATTIDIDVDSAGSPTSINAEFTLVNTDTGLHTVGSPLYDSSNVGLGLNIHHFKVELTGAYNLEVTGVELASDTTYTQLGGKALIDKVLTTHSQASLTLPTQTAAGARSIRYVDRADDTLKWATQNVGVVQTALNGAASAAATALTVDDTTGFEAGDMIQIIDTDGDYELNIISSITPTTTINVVNGLGTNMSDNSVVRRYCKTRRSSNIDFDNHEYLGTRGFICLGNSDYGPSFSRTDVGTAGDFEFTYPSGLVGAVGNEIKQDKEGETIGVSIDSAGDFLKYTTTASALAIAVKNSATTTANQIGLQIDGVDVDIDLPDDDNLLSVYPIYSDMQVGSHEIQLTHAGGATDDRCFFAILEYTVKKHTDLDDQRDGGEIFEIIQPAEYNTNPTANPSDISSGIFRFNPLMGALFRPISTGTAGWDWATSQTGQPFGGYVRADAQTGCNYERTFFGTGFEILGVQDVDGGHWDLYLDGTLLTTDAGGNFPSAVGTSYESGNTFFTESTGRLDFYHSATANCRAIITGLDIGYHLLEIRSTNSKDASSTAYTARVTAFDVIGAPSIAVGQQVTSRDNEVYLGSWKDSRKFGALDTFQNISKRSSFQRLQVSTTQRSFSAQGVLERITCSHLCSGRPVMVDFEFSCQTSNNKIVIDFELIIDGMLADQTAPLARRKTQEILSTTDDEYVGVSFGPIVLKKGYHDFAIACTRQSGLDNLLGNKALLIVREV